MTETPEPQPSTAEQADTPPPEPPAAVEATPAQLADAQAAYAAYGEHTGGLNVRGEPLPDWDGLGVIIQGAWVAGSAAVRTRAERDAHARLL